MATFDINLFLVIATLVTGFLWLTGKLFFSKKKERQPLKVKSAKKTATDAEVKKSTTIGGMGKLYGVIDYARSFFPVLFIILVIRSFILEPFQIPSGSMLPTLQIGDFIVVNKFSYGLRLPVWNRQVIAVGQPERGDVMVFRYPVDQKTHFIKRVIGLPGDKITYKSKRLYVNDVLVKEVTVVDPVPAPPLYFYQEYLQKNAINHADNTNVDVDTNAVVSASYNRHHIQKDYFRPGFDNQWVVPENHYFVMGDNRDNSNDSRFWGFVPEKLIVGKAFYIWMYWPDFFRLPSLRRNGQIH